jgi:hypothetical protein
MNVIEKESKDLMNGENGFSSFPAASSCKTVTELPPVNRLIFRRLKNYFSTP